MIYLWLRIFEPLKAFTPHSPPITDSLFRGLVLNTTMLVFIVFCLILQCYSTRISQVLKTFPHAQKVNLFGAEKVDDFDMTFLVDLNIPLRLHDTVFDFSGIEKQHLVWIHNLKPSEMDLFISSVTNAMLIHNYWFVSIGNASAEQYFKSNAKRFSLNILLFFVQDNGSQIIIKQVLGTATSNVQIRVSILVD